MAHSRSFTTPPKVAPPRALSTLSGGNRSDPHFTVDATKIYQHIDTGIGARALKNLRGGVQTNRKSAVQIEVVGFAHLPKGAATLKNVQKLCNWIEQEHGIPKEWPSGPPKPAVNGRDPGDHNRSVANWNNKGGHYGHSQVPENTHWDPAYTAFESAFVIAPATMGASASDLESLEDEPDLTNEVSRMPDHADPHGVGEEAVEAPAPAKAARKRRKPPAKKVVAKRKTTKSSGGKAKSKVSTAAKAKRPAKKAKKGARKTMKASKKAKSKKAAKTRGKN